MTKTETLYDPALGFVKVQIIVDSETDVTLHSMLAAITRTFAVSVSKAEPVNLYD